MWSRRSIGNGSGSPTGNVSQAGKVWPKPRPATWYASVRRRAISAWSWLRSVMLKSPIARSGPSVASRIAHRRCTSRSRRSAWKEAGTTNRPRARRERRRRGILVWTFSSVSRPPGASITSRWHQWASRGDSVNGSASRIGKRLSVAVPDELGMA